MRTPTAPTSRRAPAIKSQDDEANNGALATPLVAHLFEVAYPPVDAFDVVVGTNALGGWAVQVGDHLGKLVQRQHVQGTLQVRVGLILGNPDQGRTPAARLVRAQCGVEQGVELDHEGGQGDGQGTAKGPR